jgi:hypothetical protein
MKIKATLTKISIFFLIIIPPFHGSVETFMGLNKAPIPFV